LFTIDVNPSVIIAGSFRIGWGWIFTIIAAAAALVLFNCAVRKSKLQKHAIIILSVLVPLCGFIFAHLLYVLESFIFFHDISSIAGYNLRAYGLFIGTALVAYIYVKITKVVIWQILDTGILSLLLFMAIYRIGCVLVGCCYGIPCDLPWAVTYINPATAAPLNTAIHPTQLYHLIWNVIVFVTIWFNQKKFIIEGQSGLLAFVFYCSGDFVIRFFRGDEPTFVFPPMTVSQIIGLIFIVISMWLIVFRIQNAKRRQSTSV
jgi:phosphatidylglycerol---prolipoprotein diacylglyceryl transferase